MNTDNKDIVENNNSNNDENNHTVTDEQNTVQSKTEHKSDDSHDNNRRRNTRFNNNRGRDNKRFEKKRLEFNILSLKRVSRTNAGGRKMRFSILLVAKIAHGVIGIGKAKSTEISDAIQIAVRQAEKNTISIPLYERRTFSHKSVGEFGATKLLILPRAKEKGLRALGVPRKLAKMAGIKDGVIRLLTKAKSKYNICYAFEKACNQLTKARAINE